MCPVDYFRLFCHGALGGAFPVTGSNPVNSRQVSFLDSMYDALTVPQAPFMTYGPLQLRMGNAIHAWAHNFRATALGVTSMFAHFGAGGYIQPLYPDTHDDCTNVKNAGNHASTPGYMAAMFALPLAEHNNRTSDQDRVVSAAWWPRFTCCNYCAGSNEVMSRFFQVGKGFLPQLVR